VKNVADDFDMAADKLCISPRSLTFTLGFEREKKTEPRP
jgi:hypothetical protein